MRDRKRDRERERWRIILTEKTFKGYTLGKEKMNPEKRYEGGKKNPT